MEYDLRQHFIETPGEPYTPGRYVGLAWADIQRERQLLRAQRFLTESRRTGTFRGTWKKWKEHKPE